MTSGGPLRETVRQDEVSDRFLRATVAAPQARMSAATPITLLSHSFWKTGRRQ